MMELLRRLLSAGEFMPHGHCYLWNPGLVWLHVSSDALIFLAYVSIPLTLVYFVRKRTDLPFHWIFLWFGAFIIACGLTHFMEIINLWRAYYWVAGGIKAVTALASIGTAVAFVRLVPSALALPSPRELERMNAKLEKEILDRTKAEEKLAQGVAESQKAQEEMERFTRLAVGRERQMIALKGEINKLSRALGKSEPYDLSFSEEEKNT